MMCGFNNFELLSHKLRITWSLNKSVQETLLLHIW